MCASKVVYADNGVQRSTPVQTELESSMNLEMSLPPTLHKLSVVSARTGMSRSALYREINAGRLKTVKIGRSVRVREQDLNAFINALAIA